MDKNQQSKKNFVSHMKSSLIEKQNQYIDSKLNNFRNDLEKKILEIFEKINLPPDLVSTQTKSEVSDTEEAFPVNSGISMSDFFSQYEQEGLLLKQRNREIQKEYYLLKFEIERLKMEASHPVSKDSKHWIEEIKKLEEKKSELIKDNIQINQYSEELLIENQRLHGELSKLKHQYSDLTTHKSKASINEYQESL